MMKKKGKRKMHELRVKERDKHAAYVLITCGEPNAEGKMNVEMTYEGDPVLAQYLLENARNFIPGE